MKTHLILHRILLAAAVMLFAGRASADDFLLLRDGTQKRGILTVCDQGGCRIGDETVTRTSIAWIGLGRDAPTPPAARDPTRDEVHLVNRSVQGVTLRGVDSGFVHTTLGGQTAVAASSLPRASVAWIHLRHPQLGTAPTPGTIAPRQTKNNGSDGVTVGDDDKGQTKDATWKLPARIHVWMPPRCAGCQATLHVLELKVQDGTILMPKSRTIEVSEGLLTGNWFTYDPPVPIFPATTEVDRFSFDGERKTSITHQFYQHSRGGAGVAGGTASSAPSGGGTQSAKPKEPSGDINRAVLGPIAPLVVAGEETQRKISDLWRERLAQERAAENRAAAQRGAAAMGSSDAKQHGVYAGAASYTETLQIANWPIIAADFVKRRGPGWEAYGKLRQTPVYDVGFTLRFSWLDRSGRGRDVDTHGYTTDWSQAGLTGPRTAMQNPVSPPSGPMAEPPSDVELLAGEAKQRAREFGAIVRHVVIDSTADVMSGGVGGVGASAAQPPSGAQSGYSHAVSLHMRWFRQPGRVTQYLGDIIRHVVEGREEGYDDLVVSAQRPADAFDLHTAPHWTPPNPKPPPPKPNFNWRP